MRWNTIGTIFRKELIDTLRDRRTLLLMVALPMLLMPGIATVYGRVAIAEQKKTQQRRLVVAASDETRDRLLGTLRLTLRALNDPARRLLEGFPAAPREALRQIAVDLGVDELDILLRAPDDQLVRGHPRFAELSDGYAAASEAALAAQAKSGGAADELRVGCERAARVLSPLLTIDFVTPEAAAARPASRAAPPVSELPGEIAADPARRAAALAIAERRIHAAVDAPRALDVELARRDDGVRVDVVYDSTIELSATAQRRLAGALDACSAVTGALRLDREGLPATFTDPISVRASDAAPLQKQVMKVAASILPYLLILMCFLGGLAPATDLGAGEKERLTLETLLVSPASRLEIALGKFGVVFLAALVASVLAVSSMVYTATSGLIDSRLSAMLDLHLAPAQILICLALIAPLAATFASVMLALSIHARSQKEAQSSMVPLQFLIIVPAMISMIPTIELDGAFAWIPVLNVALGIRSVLTAGGAALPYGNLAIIFLSTTLFAALALTWCARQFGSEKVIFRS